MPSVVEMLTTLLGQGDTMAKLGSIIGSDADEAASAVDAAAPALVGGLAEKAAGDGGPAAVGELLDGADRGVLDDVGGFLDGGDETAGNGVLDSIFGSDRDGLLDGLASQSGLGSGVFGKLLPMVAPILMSALAKKRSDDDLDADGIAGLLSDERAELESDGKLGDWFAGLLGGGAIAGVAAGAMGKLGGLMEKVEDVADAAKDKVEDVTDAAKDKVSDLTDDAKDKADDAADAAGGAKEKAADAVDGAKEKAADAAEGAKEKAADAAEGAKEKAADAADGAKDKADGAKDKADGAKDKAADAAAGAKGKSAAATGKVSDVKAKVKAAADEATASGKGKAAGAGAAAAGVTGEAKTVVTGRDDDGRGRGALGWLWWLLGALILVVLLAWILNQCGNDDETEASGGSSTTVVEEDDAAASAGDGDDDAGAAGDADADADAADSVDLQPLVDGALSGAGIDGVSAAVDGDAVTLTGTVDSEDAKAAAEAALSGVDGIGSIDNQITVEEPAADLQALVDGALVAGGITGISAAVDGDAVTLTGTVDSEDAKAAAEAALSGVDGIGSVDNQITVEAGDGGSEGAAAGTNIGEELGLAPITFRYRSAEITAEGEAILAEVVTYLEANEVNIEIQGHTDSDGTEAENVELSTVRAESVKAFLEGAGIAADRMSSVGYGESDPKVAEDTAADKAMNRRIEFVVSGG